MIPEILKYLCNRDNYYKCKKYIPRESLPDDAGKFFDYLPHYYEVVSPTAEEVDPIGFGLSWAMDHGDMSDSMQLVSDAVFAADVADSGIVQKILDKVVAGELIDLSENILIGGKATIKDIEDRLLEHENQCVMFERLETNLGAEDIVSSLNSIKTEGYDWPLKLLNNILGPLNNEFIIVAARPDGGKTTMLLHCAWHIAQQLEEDDVILWFNNEEHPRTIKLRLMQSITGLPETDVLQNAGDLVEMINSTMFDVNKRIKFIDDSTDIRLIQKLIRKHNPKLVIIDQLFKVRGSVQKKEGNEAERYRAICEWARNVAKHNCPVIVSSQLDFTAQGEKYPTMESLYMSKTGAQGEADAILMLGSTPSEPNTRYIHTPKNKLTGNIREYEAYILKDIARFQDA